MTFSIRAADPASIDPAAFALMWNRSDCEWPDGWTSGVDWDAETARDWLNDYAFDITLIAESEHEIVGFCGLWRSPTSSNEIYLQYLNVEPHAAGRGVGRSLLIEALRETIRLKAHRIRLETWTGNSRARELYRRLGFIELASPSMELVSLLPKLFCFPSSRKLLPTSELSEAIEHMEVTSEARSVTYRFRDQADSTAIRLDIATGRVIGYETPFWSCQLEHSTRADDHHGRQPIIVVSNRRRDALAVTIPTSSQPGTATPEVHLLPPGITKQIHGSELVRDEFDMVDVQLGGALIRLEATELAELHPTLILDGPTRLSLRGQCQASLRITNSGGQNGEFQIDLKATDGLRITPTKLVARLDAGATTDITVEIEGVSLGQQGVFGRVTAPGQTVSRRGQKLHELVVAPPHEFVTTRRRDGSLLAEWDSIQVIASPLGNTFDFYDGDSSAVATWSTVVGPPHVLSDQHEARWEISLRNDDEIVATMRTPSLVIRRVLELARGSNLMRAWTEVDNETDEPLVRTVRTTLSTAVNDAYLVLPLPQGLARGHVSLFPGPLRGARKRADGWLGQWVAACTPRLAIGELWPDRTASVDLSGFQQTSEPFTIAPRSTLRTPDAWIWFGPGTWRDVYRAYCRYAQIDESLTDAQELVFACVPGSRDVTVGDNQQIQVEVVSATSIPRDVEIAMTSSSGCCSPGRSNLQRVSAPRARVVDSVLSHVDRAGPIRVDIDVRGDGVRSRCSELLIASTAHEEIIVSHENADTVIVQNSSLRLGIGRASFGTVTEFGCGDLNELWSTFPMGAQLARVPSTFGGIEPCVMLRGSDYAPLPHGDSSVSEAFVRLAGLEWRGVAFVGKVDLPASTLRVRTSFLIPKAGQLVLLQIEVESDNGPPPSHVGFSVWPELRSSGPPEIVADGTPIPFASPQVVTDHIRRLRLRADRELSIVSPDADLQFRRWENGRVCVAQLAPHTNTQKPHAQMIVAGGTVGDFADWARSDFFGKCTR